MNSTNTTNGTGTDRRGETQIAADPALPTLVITREFDAPPERVFRAYTDPDLVIQWLGPRQLTMRIDRYDARSGGSYRYVHRADDGTEYGFYGVFHEVRPNERIVQTCTFEDVPDGVSLETAAFEDLGGRTRLVATSLMESVEARDAMLASGAEGGVREGHERLDELLRGTQAADEHRRISRVFTDRVHGVPPGAWDNTAPCEGWVARDVVRHLVEWFPDLLRNGAGIELPKGPSVDDDPVAAWTVHNDAVQALLDDPATAEKMLSNPHIGEVPLDQAVDRFYTADVFMHIWDLARATGQDEKLDPGKCAQLLEGMMPLDEVLRGSGQYGPRVEVPESADVQTRLLGFIGRTP
ncbi:TIGR03086 family metal-binding protein [Streptomyces johnsoniae]|uniref:TIGR03086 family metal-binding protein n=1 Tax=Streptomyces johnsoniae TaxID=3075532 RepID=A0ABU2S2C7_9ACTN|nr:TIGR03086 family metal-binding protein [Streptomyces sp. DSM 41886]MDT0443047.1 TIGR03086 family metal-binding protein [Streptomyces sp. DSM 41886]